MDILDKFTNLSTQKVIDLVNLNCFAVTAICYKFIPYFEKRTK
jgi:short-subunit dehydrogenase